MSRLRGYKKNPGYYEEAVKTFSFSVSGAFVGELPSSLDELPLGPPSLLLFSTPPFLVASGGFFPLQLHFRFSLINLFTCWCETKKRVGWWNVFLLNFVKKNCFPIVFSACYSFIIAQNHATYPGTLSALRAPNLKWWSANRGQNT